MTSEDRARFEVLLEDIQTKVNVIAEGQVANTERLDALSADTAEIKQRVEGLEIKTDVVAKRVDGLVDDVADVKERVVRIENHLGLNGAPTKRTRKRSKRPA